MGFRSCFPQGVHIPHTSCSRSSREAIYRPGAGTGSAPEPRTTPTSLAAKTESFSPNFTPFPIGDLSFNEEETIILPELQRLYTDEELSKVEEIVEHQRKFPSQVDKCGIGFVKGRYNPKLSDSQHRKLCTVTIGEMETSHHVTHAHTLALQGVDQLEEYDTL